MTLYEKITNEIRDLIRAGVIKHTDKLPSVCKGSKIYGVSPATIQQAYYLLETQGIIYAKERSGFYVKPAFSQITGEKMMAKALHALEATSYELITDMTGGYSELKRSN